MKKKIEQLKRHGLGLLLYNRRVREGFSETRHLSKDPKGVRACPCKCPGEEHFRQRELQVQMPGRGGVPLPLPIKCRFHGNVDVTVF